VCVNSFQEINDEPLTTRTDPNVEKVSYNTDLLLRRWKKKWTWSETVGLILTEDQMIFKNTDNLQLTAPSFTPLTVYL